MVNELSRKLGITLVKGAIPLGKTKVSVDGFYRDDSSVVLAEAWAHVGRAKSAQRNKVLADILKLALIRMALNRSYPGLKVKSYLIFADKPAAAVIGRNSWASVAADAFQIEAQVVTLDDEVVARVREAQRKQDIRISDEGESPTE